jgi:two-component system NtrC family sensor kinase
MAELAIRWHAPVSGTVVLSREFLLAENPELAERAHITLIQTPMADATDHFKGEVTSGLALVAAIPVIGEGRLLGVTYGGVLLNRSTGIVDRISETVFQNEIYNNVSVGKATIFYGDTRISTNVTTSNGRRALGTRISREVGERVLKEGHKWTDRAFVVNDWYITAYEPIDDIFGRRVGILYVGVLEAKYNDIRNQALSFLILIIVSGMVLSIVLGYVLAERIMRPVYQLIKASEQVMEGNLYPEIDRKHFPNNEIRILKKTFLKMLDSLRDRDLRQKVESEHRLHLSEKQASVGRLAAGVAHEINNPLTGVLTFSNMLLKRSDLPADIRADIQTIANATERVRKIVKGLLDFSRQTSINAEPVDLNKLIVQTISLLENQALIKGIALGFKPFDGIPVLTLDRSQIQGVIINIILNAIDATEAGGSVEVATGLGLLTGRVEKKGVEIVISDTGCGIEADNLDKIFDPFFTTKGVGKGTGLGLAVSYGIIERHGGSILVRSEVGKGSIFTVWLPGEDLSGDKNKNISG